MRPALLLLALAATVGCDRIPGQPKPDSRWTPPSAVTDFTTLYRENCLGCHGWNGVISGSIAMDGPTYLALLPPDVLRSVIENGIPGTAMPASAEAHGGTLSESQVEILVNGILAKKPSDAGPLPAYAAALGDVAAGKSVFAVACASCHGATGDGGEKAGSVINPAYLDLVTDQYLRTIVIAGRPDLGCPEFAARIPGRPITSQEVADVTAWLASHRKNEFGQPLGSGGAPKTGRAVPPAGSTPSTGVTPAPHVPATPTPSLP